MYIWYLMIGIDSFINNYADWDTYNTVYDEDFLVKGARRASDYNNSILGNR